MWKNADQNNYEHGHFLRSNRAQYKTKDVDWVKNQSENLKCISAEKESLRGNHSSKSAIVENRMNFL